MRAFADRLPRDVRALPGVEGAGITTNIPFGGDFNDSVILAEGYQMAPGESLISPYQRRGQRRATSRRWRVPLKSGRLFNDVGHRAVRRPSCIVDEALAQKFWPGQDPVGRRMFQPENVENMAKPAPNSGTSPSSVSSAKRRWRAS